MARCDFWTTNVAETQAWGSSTDEEVAGFFGCNISTPREYWSNPTGPRNYEIRVARWSTYRDPETMEMIRAENDLYVEVVAEINRRKAAA